MGDKGFVFDVNAVDKLGSVSQLIPRPNDINLENGDEVIVAALKGNNTGLYKVEALKNLSKDYHCSHIKHNKLYIYSLCIFGAVFISFFMLCFLASLQKQDPSILIGCTFFFLPCFFIGRFFALRLFGIKTRQKVDKFIKNYVKP